MPAVAAVCVAAVGMLRGRCGALGGAPLWGPEEEEAGLPAAWPSWCVTGAGGVLPPYKAVTGTPRSVTPCCRTDGMGGHGKGMGGLRTPPLTSLRGVLCGAE